MAGTVSLTGLTSDINWTNLITDIINAKKASTITPLENKKTSYQSKLSAYQSFNSLLLSLKNYIEDNDLDTQTGYAIYKSSLSSSNSSIESSNILSVSIGSVRGPGNYSIEVESLAQAEKIASDTQLSKTETLGLSGTININGKDITIETDDTLSLIATRINNAGAGVTASILSISDTEYRLVLESNTTGEEGITLIDNNDVLETLGILNSSDEKKNIIRAGANASVKIDGYSISSTSNTITNVIEGVTLTLKGPNAGNLITLSIAEDTSAISGKVSSMASSINSILSYIKTQNTYTGNNSSTPLMGDINLHTVRDNITNAIFTEVEGNTTYKSALSIGFTFNNDGTLSLDTTIFSNALNSNKTEVLNVLSQLGNTLKDSMSIFIDPYTGTLTQVEQSINNTISDIDKRIEELNKRYEREAEQLEKKFNALEVLISSSNLMKNWLTQQAEYMKNSSK